MPDELDSKLLAPCGINCISCEKFQNPCAGCLISDDGKSITFNNGNCEIYQLRYVDCNLIHNSSSNVLFQYSLGLPNAIVTSQAVCSVFSANKTDSLNKVCQLDTGKKEPYNCENTFCQYNY